MAAFAPRSLRIIAFFLLSTLVAVPAVAETQLFKAYGRVESLDVNRWTRKGYMKILVFDSNRTTSFTVGFKTQYQPDRPQDGDTVEITYFKKGGQLVAREVTVRNDYTPTSQPMATEPSTSRRSMPSTPSAAPSGTLVAPDRPMSGMVEVTASSSNTRLGPGTQYEVVQVVYRGTELSLEGATGDWYQVALPDGQRSWIHSSLVSSSEASHEKPAASTESIPLEKQVTIGVLEFQSLNEEAKKDQLGKMISEIFTTSLVDSRAFKIIEREQLNKVVQELELKQSGMVETAAQAGKLLGANAVITGSVMKIGNILRIDARIIDTGTALVISAETNTGGYDLVEIGRMADKIVRDLVQGYYFEGRS